jgi:hypothetical protein
MELIDQLESLVDSAGLDTVVATLVDLCAAKHKRSQFEPFAVYWLGCHHALSDVTDRIVRLEREAS